MEILTKIKEAVALTKTGNFHAAENIYNTLLAKNPDDRPGFFYIMFFANNHLQSAKLFKHRHFSTRCDKRCYGDESLADGVDVGRLIRACVLADMARLYVQMAVGV